MVPFTTEQEDIFAWSRSITKTTKTYLGPRGCAIVVLMGIEGGLAGVRLAKYWDVADESVGTDAIPFSISATVGVALGVASMLFTGTFPDNKSDVADDKERECLELKKQFDEAGVWLEGLIWSKKADKSSLARELAGQINDNLPSIQKKLRAAIQTEKEDERIIEVLKTAVVYVRASKSAKVHLIQIEKLIKDEQDRKQSKVPPCLIGALATGAGTLAHASGT